MFSKLDLSMTCLQMQVEAFTYILTINTHRGLYKFERLSFAVKVAPAIFPTSDERNVKLSGLRNHLFRWEFDKKPVNAATLWTKKYSEK